MKTLLITFILVGVLAFVSPSLAEVSLTNSQQALVDKFSAEFNEDVSWGLLMQNEQLIAEQVINSLMMWRCGETEKDEHCQIAAKSIEQTENNIPLALALAKVAIAKSDRIKDPKLRANHVEALHVQIGKIEKMSVVNIFKKER